MKPKELESIIKAELIKEDPDSGLLKVNEHIYITYSGKNIKALQIFATALVSNDFTIQLEHTKELIQLIQSISIALCEVNREEVNGVLEVLGMFSNNWKQGSQAFLFDYMFKLEGHNGLMLFTIAEL